MISVFAIEDTAIQVVWRALPAPRVSLEIGDQVREATAPPPAMLRRKGRRPVPLAMPSGAMGGPGAVTFEGLTPGTSYELTVRAPGIPRRVVERVTTLRSPPGRLLDTFATINDLHLGEPGFGARYGGKIVEEVWPPSERGPYSWRCVDSAIEEAVEWGARALVVKGDMTSEGRPAEFHEIGKLLARCPLPVMATLGNHEFHDFETDGRSILAQHGIHVPREPWAVDRDGIRLVFALTPQSGQRSGQIDERQRARLIALAAEAPGAAFMALHHQPQRWAWPTEYPPGIDGRQARPFLDELAPTQPPLSPAATPIATDAGATAPSRWWKSGRPRTTPGPGLATPSMKAVSARWCDASRQPT